MSGQLPAMDARYTRVAIALHWAIALLIIGNLSVGYFMGGFSKPVKAVVFPLHFSAGITVLALSLVRVAWRLTHRPPPLDARLSAAERLGAHAAHAALYVGMLLMPLTGWATASARPPHPGSNAILIWGVIPLPRIGPLLHMAPEAAQKHWHEVLGQIHSLGGWAMIALVLLHIAGALKHQWFDGVAELPRMGLGRAPRP